MKKIFTEIKEESFMFSSSKSISNIVEGLKNRGISLDKDTKFVMMFDGEVVKQFDSERELSRYLHNASRVPWGVMGEIHKVVNGVILPYDTYESVEESFEELREEYGLDIWEDYSYELDSMFDSIDEAKMVTFGGNTYPKFGWCVVLAGGSGSGKGTVRRKFITIDAKVLDVDRLKKLYVAAAKSGKIEDTREYNFKNPEDVNALHQIVKKRGFKDKTENSFFDSINSDRKPNVIFDITGDDPKKLASIGKKVKGLGYKTSLVWVVTNREEAFIRNLKRDRVVPERVFHATHNDVAKAVDTLLKSADARFYDEAWLVFNSLDSAKELTPEQQKELENMGAFKLEKSGSSFVVPKEVEMRVHKVLGPMETNPDNPENYVRFDDFKKEFDANVKKVKSGEMNIRKDR